MEFVLVSNLCISLVDNAMNICIGTPALTSRYMVEDDMRQVARFIDEGVKIAVEVDIKVVAGSGKSTTKMFKEFLAKDDEAMAKINELKGRVEDFAKKFPIPGFDDK